MTTNLNNAVFSSANRYEHVSLRTHVDLTGNGLANAKSFTHSLGYVPFFRLFVQYPGRSFYEPVVQCPVDQGGYFDYQIVTGVIDNNQIQVLYVNNTANPDPTIRVYCRVYAEPQAA